MTRICSFIMLSAAISLSAAGQPQPLPFGDPYQGLDVSTNGFSFAFYGGSSWRWAYEYQFAWNRLKKKWVLIKESSSHFNSLAMEATFKNTEIDATELGEITFDKFSYENTDEQKKWKVTALKTYFYDNPKLGGPHRKGYLVKGNMVTSNRLLKNFAEVSFDNGKEVTSGFILRKDMEPVQ